MVAQSIQATRLATRPGLSFSENPPGSGLMEYLGDPDDWVEDPVGSGLLDWVGD